MVDIKKTDINKMVTDNNKNTINKLRIKQQQYGLIKNTYSEERNKKSATNICNTIKPYIKKI
jgi:bifunctional ADP-heptose synthase (sugar kinase/adenylyltransferase)